METKLDNQRLLIDDYLLTWIEAFYVAKKVQGVSKGTLSIYREKLNIFVEYCEGQALKRVTQITPAFIREYLLYLEKGHNPGGIHACYRVLKTFLFWWEEETEPENWKNPIRKVKAPKLAIEPIEGVSPGILMQLVRICERGTFAGDQDAAILLCLFDTGARASELTALNLDDVNQALGDVLIRRGKFSRVERSKPEYPINLLTISGEDLRWLCYGLA